MIRTIGLRSVAAAFALMAASPSMALVNGGFELGDPLDPVAHLNGWTAGTTAGTSDGTGGLFPVTGFDADEGSWFAFVQADEDGVAETISQSIYLAAGDKLYGSFGFRATDAYDAAAGLNDYGYVSVGGTVLVSFDVLTVGDFLSSNWTSFVFEALVDGNVVLELGSVNVGDSEAQYASIAVLDNVRVVRAPAAPIPEPGIWAMMIAGFGAVGSLLRRRSFAGRMSLTA